MCGLMSLLGTVGPGLQHKALFVPFVPRDWQWVRSSLGEGMRGSVLRSAGLPARVCVSVLHCSASPCPEYRTPFAPMPLAHVSMQCSVRLCWDGGGLDQPRAGGKLNHRVIKVGKDF